MDDVVSGQQDEIRLGFEGQVNGCLQVVEMIEWRAHMQIREYGHLQSLTRLGPGRNSQFVSFIVQTGRFPPIRPQTTAKNGTKSIANSRLMIMGCFLPNGVGYSVGTCMPGKANPILSSGRESPAIVFVINGHS